ncbi:MAG: N-6 DNA methylase [Anaerolineales bacterium]|nr:N-6 DNA methylase [Anaerolineales bacterium]
MTLSANLPKLIGDYGMENIRAAILQHWANSSGVSLKTLKGNSTTQKFLSGGNSKDISYLVNYFGAWLPKPTLKDIEKSFELGLDINHRKSYGTVYTPEYIIDYLTKHSLKFAWKDRNKLPVICDPSCGSGGFLLRIAEILEADYGISGEKAFAESIIGIDIDKQALEQAKCLIELYLASKGKQIPNLEDSLIEIDTLVSDKKKILFLSRAPEGFDVIVTNPPYVKFQNLEDDYRQTLLDKYNGLASGNFSLSVLFLIKGFELLSPNGYLGVITQNNLFTSLAGKNIREYLQNQECIQRIIDFSHHKVFDNASAYTCLIILVKQKTPEFDFGTISQSADLNFKSLDNLDFAKIQVSRLKPIKWRLGKDYHLENLKKIENIGKTLKEVANIKVGFATLKDSVFFVRQRDNGCYVSSPKSNEYQIETEITRPAVKISELKKEGDLLKNNRRIIFPYYKKNNAYKLIPELELQRDFPNAYAYLLESRQILETRDKGKKSYENWYAWARTQGMEAPAPKLLTKTFSKFPQFFMDNTDQLFCNGYAVSAKQATLFEPSLPIEVLGGILNSKIMYYYAKLTSFQIEGDYQCYQKNFIERFGIPNLTSDMMDEILKKNQDEVDRYLALIYGIDMDEIIEIIGNGQFTRSVVGCKSQ